MIRVLEYLPVNEDKGVECLDVPHGFGDSKSVPAVRANRDGALRERHQQVGCVLLQTEVGRALRLLALCVCSLHLSVYLLVCPTLLSLKE